MRTSPPPPESFRVRPPWPGCKPVTCRRGWSKTMAPSTTSAPGRIRIGWRHEHHDPLVHHPRGGRRVTRAADRGRPARAHGRGPLADRELAALSHHRLPSQPRPDDAGLPRHSYRHRRGGSLYRPRLERRPHSVLIPLPDALARARRGRDVPARRRYGYEPAPPDLLR